MTLIFDSSYDLDLLEKNDPEDFTQTVLRIMNDAAFASKITENGRHFVMDNYSLDSAINRIEGSYHELLR